MKTNLQPEDANSLRDGGRQLGASALDMILGVVSDHGYTEDGDPDTDDAEEIVTAALIAELTCRSIESVQAFLNSAR